MLQRSYVPDEAYPIRFSRFALIADSWVSLSKQVSYLMWRVILLSRTIFQNLNIYEGLEFWKTFIAKTKE